MIRFINRRTELDFLKRKFDASGAQFVVIYGRRRVGKTELIKQFCGGKKALYFLADRRGTLLNLERFAEKAADHFNDISPRVESFYDLFRYLVRHTGSERYVIVIDEFSYLIERDDTIPSVFQVIWDECLKKENIMLILCGSSVSMMAEGTLSEKSPLYGRRTGQWKLESLKAYHLPEVYPGIDFERAVEFYSALGGIPLYLLEFDSEKDVFGNIREHILTKGEILYEETETLLKEELREYYLYISIFEAIAKGKTRLVEISDHSKVPQKDLPKYVGTLMRLELVGKEHPVTESERSKKTRYFIKDNFFRFYFRYVHPNKAEIEYGYPDKVVSVIKKDFNSFVGTTFENIASDFMMKPENLEKLPFSFSRMGRQWGKIKGAPRGKNTYEIDIVGLNDKSKEIMFIECKWKELSERDAIEVLNEVKEKSRFVQWEIGARKEYFGVIAKRVEGKDRIRAQGFFVSDLDDF